MPSILITSHLSDKKPMSKKTYVVNDEDYDLINNVFPERGYNAHLPGFLYNLLANELRKKGITNCYDRLNEGYANVGRLLSDIIVARCTDSGHVGRGTDETPHRPAPTTGVTSHNEKPTRKRQTKKTKHS